MTTEEVNKLLLQIQNLVHVATSAASVVILVNIWYNYYRVKVRSFHKTPKDYGLIFLCAGILVWASISILSLVNEGEKSQLGIGIISALNNGFFMASFAYFRHGFEWFSSEKNRGYWIVSIGVLTISVVLTICLIGVNDKNEIAIGYIDFAYTIITALFLGGLLFKSFESRHLYFVAFVSLSVVFLAIYGQMLGLPNPPIQASMLHKVSVFIISQTLMLAIFVSLAFSWVIENAEIIKEIKEDEIANTFLENYAENNASEVENALKDLVDRGEMYDAIVVAKAYFKRKGNIRDKKLEELLSNLSGQLTSLNIENRAGILRREDYTIERNRIRWALNKAIDEISKTDTSGRNGQAPEIPIIEE